MLPDYAGPADGADRQRWNARYAGDFVPSFRPGPLAVRALSLDRPPGPVADLACGPSGTALLAAASGCQVTAVDVSEVALAMLAAEASRRGLDHLITLVHADLGRWRPEPRSYAVLLCTGFWDAAVFGPAAEAVAPGGVLGWLAYTEAARAAHPSLAPGWCLAPGEPASLLPGGFSVVNQSDVPDHDGRGPAVRRQLLARRHAGTT